MDEAHQALIFPTANQAHRGVNVTEDDYRGDVASERVGRQKRGPSQMPSIRPDEMSLMKCIVGDKNAAEKAWITACDSLNNLNNVDPIVLKNVNNDMHWRAIGNFYQHSGFCEFLMAMYEKHDNNEQHVLDFKRMSGDGFVMDTFFRLMKTPLDATGLTINTDTEADGETDDDDMDMFDDYSSDSEDEQESDVEQEFLKPGGFLKLENDEQLVSHWMKQVQNRHIEDQNHMLGLMAHNSEHKGNRQIMLKQAGEILEMITLKLQKADNAALVRNASVLLNNIIVDLPNLEEEQKRKLIPAMFKAMKKWCPGAEVDQMLVTQSRETIKYLSLVLATLEEKKMLTDEDREVQARKILGGKVDQIIKVVQLCSTRPSTDGALKEKLERAIKFLTIV